MNKNKPNTNPKQRIKMLIRRIRTQKRIITSLEERNYHLVTELNDTKVAMANTTNEYNKLMAKNYEQAVHLNHNQDERMKLTSTIDELDVEAVAVLKSLGSASEVLLNLKKMISHIKSNISEYKPEATIVLPSSPFSSQNEISLSVKRNQAAVSPMVKGYVISNPTITLKRLRLNEIGDLIEPGRSDDTRSELSPIAEEPVDSEPRSRLGKRGQHPQQFTERAASKLNEFIPEAHAEPVVRLSDVSRLLSNTSWLNVNFTPTKDNTTYSSPCTSSAPSVSGINVFPTDSITLRERKKRKKTNKVNDVDKIESSSGSSENLKIKDTKSVIMGAENNEDKSCEHEISESSLGNNNEGTSNKNSCFEDSKFAINASVKVNEIEESVEKESIIQLNKNSNEENVSKCSPDIESTSKFDSNVLSDKGNDEKKSLRNIETSVENANSVEVGNSTFRISEKLEYIGNPDVVSSITANKEDTSDGQSSESRGTVLLDNEIDNGSNRTFLVRNSKAPVRQKNPITKSTRKLPVFENSTSNETESEKTVIEESMNLTTSVKTSPKGVRELQRPRSTRIKKPSIKVLEAVKEGINEGSSQVKSNLNRANRVSPKKSKCVAESDERASSSDSLDSKASAVGGSCKRTSSRIKKTVVYRDEPLTSQEIRKILLKGLRKNH